MLGTASSRCRTHLTRARSLCALGLCALRVCVLAGCMGALLLAVSGCAYTGDFRNYLRNGLMVGPNYHKPVAEVEQQWIDAYDEQVFEQLPRYNQWWEVFNDAHMTTLVNEAYLGNLPLQEAGMRVLESRSQLGITVGSIFPQQQEMYGEYRRTQISKTSIENRPLLATHVPRAFDRWSVGFDAAWELDVWGKFRRNIEAADASLDATIEEYDDILVTLLAETAATYVEMRTAQTRIRLAQENVKAQQGTLGIAEARYKTGETDELDAYQAKTNVANTLATIPTFQEQERKAQIRLCLLMGIPPRDLTEQLGTGPIPSAPPILELGMPADLLRRRPDVRKAEREVAAQSALIGAAAADLLPQVSIKGSLYYSAQKFGDLFNNSSLAGVLTPGFQWSILNYGRLANNVILQDTKFQELVLRYRETALRANADVERAVVSFLKGQQRVAYLQDAVNANQMALKIATDQYTSGETNFNEIFTLQAYLVEEQDALAEAQGQVALALISVYKALGGGWQIRCEQEAPMMAPELLTVPPAGEVQPEAVQAPAADHQPAPQPAPLPPPDIPGQPRKDQAPPQPNAPGPDMPALKPAASEEETR